MRRPNITDTTDAGEIALRSVRLREIRLTLREPFRISSGVTHTRRVLLVEAEDEDGILAWSECVAGETPNYHPETIDGAWLILRDHLAPRMIGQRFGNPGAVDAALGDGVRGHRMARAALEMASWGLSAERARRPLASLLGGERSAVATGISLGIQESPEALVERVEAAFAEGYRKVKIKIQPGADLEYIRAAREVAGPRAGLMADANSAYTPDDAEHLAQLDEFDLMMIEQPLAWDDLTRHAELQRRLRTPICLDESITHVGRAADMFQLGAGRIINIKPGRVGGLTESMRIHDLALARGAPVWCGGMLESGIGRAYNVALASLPGFTLPGDISPSARYWDRDIVTPEWTMGSDGMVQVPHRAPGLGVMVDRDRIEDLTVRSEVVGG